MTDRAHAHANIAASLALLGSLAALFWAVSYLLLGPLLAGAVVIGVLVGLALGPGIPLSAALKLARARPFPPGAFPAGESLVARLAARAGLEDVPILAYVPSATPNAFALESGEGPAICVTDGLLRSLSPREMAGVLAHEIAHIAHADLRVLRLADALVRVMGLMGFAGQVLLPVNLVALMFGAPLVAWYAPLVLIFAPVAGVLVKRSLARVREFDADRGAAALTGDPAALASALMRVERTTGGLLALLMPHLERRGDSVLRTHPSTRERVARLRALAGPHLRPA